MTVSDPRRLAKLVTAFDASPTNFLGGECGMQVAQTDYYSVTFHWPGHNLYVDPGHSTCVAAHHLTLNSHELRLTLPIEGAYDQAVVTAYATSD